MATKQGMCKNCGSLIIFADRSENCECIFCHCIFPGAEAVKILENPDDYTFAKWMEYHFATCERQDLIGASNHTLDILKVRG